MPSDSSAKSSITPLASTGWWPSTEEPRAARLLLRGRDASDGFTTLREAGRLEMSVEAATLLPWFATLFTEQERTVARRRLDEHRFDVSGFLVSSSAHPPNWVQTDTDG